MTMFFFEGYEKEGMSSGTNENGDMAQGDLLSDKEALDLVRSYYAIPENQRRKLFDLARVLSSSG